MLPPFSVILFDDIGDCFPPNTMPNSAHLFVTLLQYTQNFTYSIHWVILLDETMTGHFLFIQPWLDLFSTLFSAATGSSSDFHFHYHVGALLGSTP